jgi:thiamine monophosphate synthase
VDFLVVGTIFESASHPGMASGGLGRLHEIQGVVGLPLLAIGGVTAERVEEVVAAGAYGVAVRGGIWDSSDPKEATRGYLKGLEGGSVR